MFEIGKDDYQIRISKGDSGGFCVDANGRRLTSNDRVLFTVKNKVRTARKEIVYIERVYKPDVYGKVMIEFNPTDTIGMAPGQYQWDLRYMYGVVVDDVGNILSVKDVETPFEAASFRVLDTVGEVFVP